MTDPQLPGQIALEEYLTNLDAPVLEEVAAEQAGDVENYTLDDAKAATLLRRLGVLEKAVEANTDTAQRELNKIVSWMASVNEPLQNEALHLRKLLEGYALHARAQDENRKSISTPFGTISTRTAQPEWVVTDKDALLTWAKESNIADLVRVKEEPAMTVLKNSVVLTEHGQVMTPEGEVAPGLEIRQPAVPYSVTIKARR